MKQHKWKAACLVLLTIVVSACTSEKTMPQDDIDAYFNTGASDELVVVNYEGFWWPAKRVDNMILESNPPQINITIEHSQEQKTIVLDTVVDPAILKTNMFVAELYTQGSWKSMANFKFEAEQFYIKLDEDEKWRAISSNNIRFNKRQ